MKISPQQNKAWQACVQDLCAFIVIKVDGHDKSLQPYILGTPLTNMGYL